MTTFDDALATAAAEYAGVVRQVAELTAAGDAAVAMWQDQFGRLRAEFDAYKASHPDAPRRTIFGGCPAGGGTSLAAAQSVIDKWGGHPAIRMFQATGVSPRPVDAGVMHVSWKPTAAQITPAWVTKVCANLLENDCVEVWHEADSKVRKGQLKFDDVVGRKNKFFDAVKSVRPDLRVVNTLTGQALSDYGHDEWQKWGVVRADLLGLDADGIHDKVAPLDIPYEDEIARVARFLSANPGYAGWVVPEFGTSRPGWDAKGMERAAWASKYGGLFAAAGAAYVCLYDYPSTPGNTFAAGTAEFDVWRGLTG